MSNIPVILCNYLVIKLFPVSKIDVFRAYPLVHLRQNVFKVADAVVARFNRVVSEVFSTRTRVIYSIRKIAWNLLGTISVHRIAGFLVQDFLGSAVFVPDILGSDNRSIEPFDGIFVVHAEAWRNEFHAFVRRLCDIVISGIIHNGWGSAIFSCECRVSQRFGRVG